MLVALAAGALVLSTVALVVTLWPRARTADGSPSAASGTSPDPLPPSDVRPGLVTSVDTAGAVRRLAVADAAARIRDAEELATLASRAVAAVAPRATTEVRLDGAPVAVDRSPAPGQSPASGGDRCPVPDVGSCPAVRHATVVVCADSAGLDACPWLAVRPGAPVAATCAPVATAGRGVGFLHVVEASPAVPGGAAVVGPEVVAEVSWLAAHLGSRLESLDPGQESVTEPPPSPPEPVDGSSGASAAPDSPVVLDLTVPAPGGVPEPADPRSPAPVLGDRVVEVPVAADPAHPHGATGWSDPAAFHEEVAAVLAAGTAFVLVLAGVDDHDVLLATRGRPVAESAVAALGVELVADPDPLGTATLLACSRLDESTVAVAWSGLTLGRSVELIEVVRSELLDAELAGSAPACRRSYGLTHSSISSEPAALVAAARAGLERARALGGDQIVYADLTLLDGPPAPG